MEIQSPEVQARMMENRKEADLKYKEKKKQHKQAQERRAKNTMTGFSGINYLYYTHFQ